jgi:hypothetical protein
MKMTHYYLIDTSVVIPGAAVSALQFNIIKEEPFTVHNLEVCNSKWLLEKYEVTITPYAIILLFPTSGISRFSITELILFNLNSVEFP